MAWLCLCVRENNNCPRKEKCLRYNFIPDGKTDSYASFPNICNKKNKYKYFMKDTNDIEIKSEE